MWYRRLALAAMALAGWAGSASASILVSSFEQQPFTGPEAGITYSYSNTKGVTDGTYSIQADVVPTWYKALGTMDLNPATLKANPLISFDITHADTGSGSWTNFLDVIPVIQGDGLSWTELPKIAGIPNDGKPHHYVVDATAKVASLSGSGWGQIVFIYATQEAHPVFLDNLRIAAVPEPATLGLVSLAGLAMIRRRRAA